ncbi:MAG TPA: hypothetical protein VJX73_04595 [Terracidiphilus sp.]|nr:hypothetical protein [Terracidiphilus sp.]
MEIEGSPFRAALLRRKDDVVDKRPDQLRRLGAAVRLVQSVDQTRDLFPVAFSHVRVKADRCRCALLQGCFELALACLQLGHFLLHLRSAHAVEKRLNESVKIAGDFGEFGALLRPRRVLGGAQLVHMAGILGGEFGAETGVCEKMMAQSAENGFLEIGDRHPGPVGADGRPFVARGLASELPRGDQADPSPAYAAFEQAGKQGFGAAFAVRDRAAAHRDECALPRLHFLPEIV